MRVDDIGNITALVLFLEIWDLRPLRLDSLRGHEPGPGPELGN